MTCSTGFFLPQNRHPAPTGQSTPSHTPTKAGVNTPNALLGMCCHPSAPAPCAARAGAPLPQHRPFSPNTLLREPPTPCASCKRGRSNILKKSHFQQCRAGLTVPYHSFRLTYFSNSISLQKYVFQSLASFTQ